MFAAPAFAQATSQLNINAQVNASCKVTTASANIDIAYDVFTPAANNGSATFQVRCTKGLTVRVAADGGLNGAAGGLARSVKSGTLPLLGYKLSFTAADPELVPNTATDSGVVTGGKASDVPVPVYVALDAAADPAFGTYTDQVVLTYTAQ